MKVCLDIEEVIKEDDYIKIQLTDDLMRQITQAESVELVSIKPGRIFMDTKGTEYIVLNQSDGVTEILQRKVLKKRMAFGSCNDWKTCPIHSFLNYTYLTSLDPVFRDSIVEFDTDLLSLDGLDEYGVVKDKISLLTLTKYRKYRKVIEDVDDHWLLATPDSTASGWSEKECLAINGRGAVYSTSCSTPLGIRPYFILDSSIQVLKPVVLIKDYED